MDYSLITSLTGTFELIFSKRFQNRLNIRLYVPGFNSRNINSSKSFPLSYGKETE